MEKREKLLDAGYVVFFKNRACESHRTLQFVQHQVYDVITRIICIF